MRSEDTDAGWEEVLVLVLLMQGKPGLSCKSTWLLERCRGRVVWSCGGTKENALLKGFVSGGQGSVFVPCLSSQTEALCSLPRGEPASFGLRTGVLWCCKLPTPSRPLTLDHPELEQPSFTAPHHSKHSSQQGSQQCCHGPVLMAICSRGRQDHSLPPSGAAA